MKNISITRKESRQNLISSFLLTAIFGFMSFMMKSIGFRIAFLIPAAIFCVYFLVWIGIIVYHALRHIPYSEPEPEEVHAEAGTKELKTEEQPRPQPKYRTYSPIKERLEDIMAEEVPKDSDDNEDPGEDDHDDGVPDED